MNAFNALYNKDGIQQLEQLAVTDGKLNSSTLMERAASSILDIMLAKWPKVTKVSIFCGIGKNAGDGMLLAHLLQQKKISVQLITAIDFNKKPPNGELLAAYNKVSKLPITVWDKKTKVTGEIIVDALVGNGLNKPLQDKFHAMVKHINRLTQPVISIDLPSGLDPNTGRPSPIAVQANLTVTLLGLKTGLFTGKARDYARQIRFAALDVPPDCYSKVVPSAFRVTYNNLRGILKPRPNASHKGDFGHLLIVGGDHGMLGAPCIAGKSAMRTGVGAVTVAASSGAKAMTAHLPEIMWYECEKAKHLDNLFSRASTMLLGPGLGQTKWSLDLWRRTVACEAPLVVDADGLNLLAEHPMTRSNWILTPHPGEAARLLDTDVATIEHDRYAAAKELSAKYQATIVLKGSGTIIAIFDDINNTVVDQLHVCDLGNPLLATAGTGDILAGVISALLAQKVSPINAARLGVFAHSLAADRAAKRGIRGAIASDLLGYLHNIINTI